MATKKNIEREKESLQRISERFEILEQMAEEISRGSIKGLVVYGAPGVGKSYGVEKALDRESLQDKLAFDPSDEDQDTRRIDWGWDPVNNRRVAHFKPRHTIIRGSITPAGLYRTLYEYSGDGEVIVFDDTDAVLQDEVCLNYLKVALDSSQKRIISCIGNGSNKHDAPPQSFEFKGSVIFITNLNFEKTIAANFSKMSPHLEAILSRCLYLDLTIETTEDKILRIKDVVSKSNMLESKGLDQNQIDDVIAFVENNAEHFRELSLRKVHQLADLRKIRGNWERIAELTLFKK